MVISGQCIGAKNYVRLRKTVRASIVYAVTASLGLGIIVILFSEPLLSIMTDSPAVISIAQTRLTVLCLTYFTTSIMEIFSFTLRPLDRAGTTMVVGAVCGLGVRWAWVMFVWPLFGTLGTLYFCFFPSSVAAVCVYLAVYFRRLNRLVSAAASGREAMSAT